MLFSRDVPTESCFAGQGNHSHTLPNGAHLDVVLNNLGNVSQKFLKLNEHLT